MKICGRRAISRIKTCPCVRSELSVDSSSSFKQSAPVPAEAEAQGSALPAKLEEEKQQQFRSQESELQTCQSEALLEQKIAQLKVLGLRVIYFIACQPWRSSG